MEKKSSAAGWIVVMAGTGINLALGALYAWSMFKAELIQAPYNLSNAQAALPYSIACIVFALMMIPAGRMQDKLGPRIVATIGGVCLGVGFFLSSMIGNSPENALTLLLVGFGVLGGAGIGLGYAAASPPAIKWFPPQKKGLIVGIVVGGFGLASVYVAPLTRYLVDNGGIASAFKILAVLFFLMLVIFAQFLKNPPEGYVAAAPAKKDDDKKGPAPAAAKDYTFGEMLKTPQVWLIWLMYCIGAGAGLMVISLIKGLSAEIETITIAGFIFVALLAVGNAGGRVISGVLSDKIGRTNTMLLVFVVQAIMLVLFTRVSSNAGFIVGSMIIGFSYGSCLSVFPSITADFYGMKNFGLNYGFVFSAWGFGALIMAPLAGKIKDATGSYSTAFYVAAAALVVGAILTFVVKPPAQKKT
ncbi:MAG TPA: OFA family MFS transporter [bacterium]|nr:OFA family MFS transporter [bacterium]